MSRAFCDGCGCPEVTIGERCVNCGAPVECDPAGEAPSEEEAEEEVLERVAKRPDFLALLERSDRYSRELAYAGFGQFKKIRIGRFQLSIQGSRHHYSEPRAVVDTRDYTALEVAMFDENGEEWLHPKALGIPVPIADEWEGAGEDVPPSHAVCPYADVDRIQELIDWLCETEGAVPEVLDDNA